MLLEAFNVLFFLPSYSNFTCHAAFSASCCGYPVLAVNKSNKEWMFIGLRYKNEFGEKVYATYSIIIINKNSAYFITFSEAI